MGKLGESIVTRIELDHNGTWIIIDDVFAIQAQKHNGQNTSNIHVIVRRGTNIAAGNDASNKEILPDTDNDELSHMVLKIAPSRPLIRIGLQRELYLVNATADITFVNFLSPEKIMLEELSPGVDPKIIISKNLQLCRASR